jgi:hypothetical protein
MIPHRRAGCPAWLDYVGNKKELVVGKMKRLRNCDEENGILAIGYAADCTPPACKPLRGYSPTEIRITENYQYWPS